MTDLPVIDALSARTGAITLIRRFGSALNLNIYVHMLILDGTYLTAQLTGLSDTGCIRIQGSLIRCLYVSLSGYPAGGRSEGLTVRVVTASHVSWAASELRVL